jgi:hypothetical protein
MDPATGRALRTFGVALALGLLVLAAALLVVSFVRR